MADLDFEAIKNLVLDLNAAEVLHAANSGGVPGKYADAAYVIQELTMLALSDTSIDGKLLSWKEVATRQRKEISGLQDIARMVSDLDRSAVGRHKGDAEGEDPTGVSQGNPNLKVGQIIGYDIGGHPYIVPERTTSRIEDWSAFAAGLKEQS